MPTIPPISSRTDRYVRFLRKRAWTVVGLTAVLATAGALFATHLELKTDLAELLPDKDPSVQELRRLQDRLPGYGALLVNIHSPDRAANLRFADALSERVRALPPDLVQVAVSNLRAEHRWFEEHKWLYASLTDLQKLHDRLDLEIQKRKNPLLIDIDDAEETLDQMKARLEHRGDGFGHLPDDYFVTADGQTASVVILPPGGIFHEHAGEQLVRAVRNLITELEPAQYGHLDIGLSGDIESGLEERDALENDLVWATSICILLVCVIVVAFYGRLRAVPLMAAPALVGTTVAFGLAEVLYGNLNSSTAFLGSIIVGNGINFAIIQLARYEEERRVGVVPAVALVRAVAGTVRATAIAALAASIAYGSLVLTRFRGFSQFGVIGGVGMVMAWVATVTVLPSILWLLDRNRTRYVPPKPGRGAALLEGVARLSTGAPHTLILIGGAITALALLILPRYAKDPFEYNFKNLRSSRSESGRGEGRWLQANNQVFRRSLSPIVILTERPDQIEPTRRALRDADARVDSSPMLDRIVSIDDLLPGMPAEQAAKRAVLGQIRGLMGDRSFQLLDDAERADLLKYMPPEQIAPIVLQDLPSLVRRPFTELDGRTGRVLLVFPREENYQTWDGRDLIRLAERVGEVHLPGGQVVRSAGTPVIFAGMIRSIVHDGPIATLASALGVMILVLALARGLRGAALVLGTLAAGVVWMLGGAAGLSQRVNFLNFVALPITLGIGVDYGINIYLRYRLEGPGRLLAAVRSTGGAVALCSATTIIGYGALLVADNRGLRSFGTLAILGEVACLSAALVFMPAVLALRDRQLGLARRLEAEASGSALGKVKMAPEPHPQAAPAAPTAEPKPVAEQPHE